MAVDQVDPVEPAPDALPCGRDPLTVVDDARAGRISAHSRSCEYCQQAIDEDRLLTTVREIEAEPVPAPDTLLPRVMATVFAELRPGRQIALPAAGPSASVTELAIVSTLRHHLDELPDLIVHRCRVRAGEPAGELRPEGEPALVVELTAAGAYQADLADLADQVRATAQRVLREQFGFDDVRVDVEFVDLFTLADGGD